MPPVWILHPWFWPSVLGRCLLSHCHTIPSDFNCTCWDNHHASHLQEDYSFYQLFAHGIRPGLLVCKVLIALSQSPQKFLRCFRNCFVVSAFCFSSQEFLPRWLSVRFSLGSDVPPVMGFSLILIFIWVFGFNNSMSRHPTRNNNTAKCTQTNLWYQRGYSVYPILLGITPLYSGEPWWKGHNKNS